MPPIGASRHPSLRRSTPSAMDPKDTSVFFLPLYRMSFGPMSRCNLHIKKFELTLLHHRTPPFPEQKTTAHRPGRRFGLPLRLRRDLTARLIKTMSRPSFFEQSTRALLKSVRLTRRPRCSSSNSTWRPSRLGASGTASTVQIGAVTLSLASTAFPATCIFILDRSS